LTGATPAGPASNAGPPRPSLPAKWLAGIVLLSAAVGAGTGAGAVALLDNGTSTQTAALPSASGSAPGSSTTGVISLSDLYTRLRPSVVKITVTSSATGGGGTGSGLILDTEGHIVTNYHVVANADHYDVTLDDGSIVSATVVGTDPGDDLAIIKIPAAGLNLTPVKLADATATRVGDGVVAIGNPLDLEATLTEGVVSGLGRVLNDGDGGRPLRELIQTDTAINPGNSGGGLFNLDGELIGITNAIENPSGQDSFSGIGYAIPVSTLQKYLPDMLAGKTVEHSRLGVSLVPITPSITSQFNINTDKGVMIGAVDQNSAAARAGLRGAASNQAGDIITAIDGHAVGTYDDLASYLDTVNPGDTIKLQIVRGGRQMDVSVQLDAWTNS
jgi:putative serine protease PepD